MLIKLSIITINYNDKIGLQKTIDSVVSQSWKDFEYIVIDGNSTDGSKELIQCYNQNIDYSISEPDSGIYNAMNKGIRVAKGEYILFLNSGDCLVDSTILSKVVKDLNSNIGIFYGNMLISNNGKLTTICNLPDELSFSFFLNFSLPHQANFIKKQLFEDNFYYNEHLKIMSDWEFSLVCICKKNESYKHLNYIISNFDGSGVSSNLNNTQKLLEEKKQVLQKHFPLFFEDSKLLNEINSKRFQQILVIKENKIKWTVLKFLINILTIFNTKSKSTFSKIYSKIE